MRSRARARRAATAPSIIVRPDVLFAAIVACIAAVCMAVRAAEFVTGHFLAGH